MPDVRSLETASIDDIYQAWTDAFRNYERSWTREELELMLQRRGYEPALSFGAFDAGRIVSFTLNGIGLYNGVMSAYDTGTGTIASHQGLKLPAKIFEYSLPHIKAAACKQYVLEVLHNNTRAINIYEQIGFRKVRELSYFIRQSDKIHIPPQRSSDIQIRITALQKEDVSSFWDFSPSWQNSFESIERVKDNFVFLGAFIGEELCAYAIFEPASGDIAQLAVKPRYRRQGIASALTKELMLYNKHSAIKLINADRKSDAMARMLGRFGIPDAGWQYEMILDL